MQRIKSLYLYEGRWPQAAAVRRIEEARSFDQWVEEISEKRENVNELWSCVSNYYIKSLIGYPEYGAEGIDDREYQLACEVLMKFDIVLITEWMSNEATFKYLSKTLSFDYHMPSLVHPTRAKSPEENTSRLFDLKTIQKITQDNYWDCQLYSFAKQLAEERFSSCQQV